MTISLNTAAQRQKLAPRHAPYWHTISRGISVGYRKPEEAPERAVWYARHFVKGNGYVLKRLGLTDDLAPSDGETILSWKEAMIQAGALNPAKAHEDKPTRKTLLEAGIRYFEHRKARSHSGAALEQDRLSWRVYVLGEFADHDPAKLTTADLNGWLDRMVTKLAAKGDGLPEAERREVKRKTQATANRVWTIFRAVLNLAFHEGHIPSDSAWQRVKSFKGTDKPRTRVLSVPEVQALLKHLDSEFTTLAQGALYTGLRLGELLALTPEDIVDGQVHVKTGKTEKSARYIPLNPEGAAFFKRLSKGKATDESVFGIEDSSAMRVRLGRKLRLAHQAAEIPPLVFHDLRRSYGSLLLNSGASMDLISVLLGHTDLRMTRRTYAHMDQRSLAKAVGQHLPSFQPAKAKRVRAKGGRP